MSSGRIVQIIGAVIEEKAFRFDRVQSILDELRSGASR